jgi:Putative rhamnosyl transferase
MPSVQHLVETQFSVRMGKKLTREWLERRLELLRRITLPAIRAQSIETFTWLLLCDEATDAETLEQLREEEGRTPNLRVELTSEDRSPLAVIGNAVKADTDVVITTRLDSDDAITDRYLEAIQDYADSFHSSRHPRLLVNFPHGYRLDLERNLLYEDWMPNSSFHSLFERPGLGPVRTVKGPGQTHLRPFYASTYSRLAVLGPKGAGAPHVRLHHHYPTQQDESMRAWLIGVHDGNWFNRVDAQKTPLPRGAKPAGFNSLPVLAEGAEDDG